MKIVPKDGESIKDVILRVVDEAFAGKIEDFEVELTESVHYVAGYDSDEETTDYTKYHPLTYKSLNIKLNYRTKEMDDIEGTNVNKTRSS